MPLVPPVNGSSRMPITVEELTGRLNDLDAVARERVRAVRAVASASKDADECREFLAALGLEPREELEEVPAPRSAP